MAVHNGRIPSDKASYLIAALNEPAAHSLHSDLNGAKYEEVTAVFEIRYRGHHLAEKFHAQLKRKVQHAGESLKEFAAAIDHLANRAYFDSTEQNSREAARALADGLRERHLRGQLLLGNRGH
jgi:hypothetical protein